MAIEVHVDIDGLVVPAGMLYFHVRGKSQSSTFQYRSDFLARPDSYALDPQLPLSSGAFQATEELFGAFSDSAPDRWGRILIDRRARQMAREDGSAKRQVNESDYLLGVNDATRQGAIRFRHQGDEGFLTESNRAVPKVVSLPGLLDAADRIDEDDDSALKLLLDAGSASLGGARPKTAVQDQGGLLLAKFPHRSDEWNVMAWEKTALDIAERAGIETPERRLEPVGDRHILLLRRFDRKRGGRLGYMSARTLLESRTSESADYSDLAEVLEITTAEATKDLQELWRRIALSIFINNTDDHLRNHGLIRTGRGWRLAPIFDINPDPDTAKRRVTSILGETHGAAQLEALREISEQLRIRPRGFSSMLTQVRDAAADWKQAATANGLSGKEITQMADAFGLARVDN